MSYWTLFKELWRYAEQDRWKIILVFGCHFLSVSSLLFNPYIFAQILNAIQLQKGPNILSSVGHWTLIWIGSFLWFNIFHRLGRYFGLSLAYRVKQRFMNSHYKIATNLSLKWHTDHHSGDTINRVNLAAIALHDFTSMQYLYIEYFMMFWGPLIALFFLSHSVFSIAFIVSSITILTIGMFDKRLVVLYREVNDVNHKISAIFFDYISNIRTIITLRLGTQTAREFNARINLGYRPYIRTQAWVNAQKWFTITLCMMVIQAGVVFFYVWQQLTKYNGVLIGNVSAVFQYLQQLSNTFGNVAKEYQQITRWRIDYEAVSMISKGLDELPARFIAEDSKWKLVTISNLNFGYKSDLPILKDISLSFAPGDRIALVGESGSGKSSLMALLRGLYEPHVVKLTIDGLSFDSLAPLAAITTLIPQDPEIFENTIRYNITFGVEHSDEEVLEAIRVSRFDSVLERLPKGLDTDVRERGVTLSGGERQRLALARGIMAARDSWIILMDEPTSSVDAFNEAAIYDNIFSSFATRTVISSVHRLHMLGRFTRVIVMDNGHIAQTGTFEELKASDGPFQMMWRKSQDT